MATTIDVTLFTVAVVLLITIATRDGTEKHNLESFYGRDPDGRNGCRVMATKYKHVGDVTEAELENMPCFIDHEGFVWRCDAGEDVAMCAVQDLMRRVITEHKRRMH